MLNAMMEGHRRKKRGPRRGDKVERYIKRWRDKLPDHSARWYAVDDLLDDYRLHADTGTPLKYDVPEPHDNVGGMA